MQRAEELDLFLQKADELISSKYIFADVRIAGLLKAIACSDVILAMMESSMKNFDFEKVFLSSFIKNDGEAHGEYRQPDNVKDLIALVFSLLVKIDGKELDLAAVMKNFFYADGSMLGGYTLFIDQLIKPFRTAVKVLFEGIMTGKIVGAKEQAARDAEKEEKRNKPADKPEKPLPEKRTRRLPDELKIDNAAVNEAQNIIATERVKLMSVDLEASAHADGATLLDGISAALEAGDKQWIKAAYTGYKYFASQLKKPALSADKLGEILLQGKLI